VQVKFRLPAANKLQKVTVNGRETTLGGAHKDAAMFPTGTEKHFEVVAQFS
jgi:hypothetical protein